MTAAIPTAAVIDVVPNPTSPDCVLVRVRCPHCEKVHMHGGPEFKADGNYGHRFSHCGTRLDRQGNTLPPWPGQSRGYNIRTAEEAAS